MKPSKFFALIRTISDFHFHSVVRGLRMKKKAARPAKTTLKTDNFKYVQNTPYKVTESKDKPETTDDDDYNSGFGSYLRSSEGEMDFRKGADYKII